MGTHDMLWRDPLSTPGDRFPLGPPPEFWTDCDDEPSEVGIRPYSLRGAVSVPRARAQPSLIYSYDPERQITLVHDADGAVIPLSRHTNPGPTKPEKSGYQTDGDPNNPPPEEMTAPDYQDD